MIEIPKLRSFTGPYEDEEHYICSAERGEPLTEAQAAEVIRRVEAYEELMAENDMYENLIAELQQELQQEQEAKHE